MKRVLITKLSSLGDLILALPALTDARKAYPDIQFDWIVDKNFQEIPLWNSSVKHIFITNHRVWRKNLTAKTTKSEFSTFYKELKGKQYDFIIDAQGNIKSALISLLAQGERIGFDASSTIEWGSHFFYQTKCHASKELHAIQKLRILFAKGLNYPLPQTPPNYQINLEKLKKPSIEVPSDYLIFVPIASYESKLWPESHWKELINLCSEKGQTILLPWGNLKEKERAQRLAIAPQVQVLPRLSLNEIGYLVSRAKGMVSVDTGLSHMAAALGTPCITLYGPTDPNLTGTIGESQFWIRSSTPCHCKCKKTCFAQKHNSKCLGNISSRVVFENLNRILNFY